MLAIPHGWEYGKQVATSIIVYIAPHQLYSFFLHPLPRGLHCLFFALQRPHSLLDPILNLSLLPQSQY